MAEARSILGTRRRKRLSACASGLQMSSENNLEIVYRPLRLESPSFRKQFAP
jgi:hypothetical protein